MPGNARTAMGRSRELKRRSRSKDAESGAAALEFGLVLVPFLLLVFGLIQYGIYFASSQAGSHAANTAVRELSVGRCTDAVALRTYVEKMLQGSYKDGTATVSTSYRNPDGTVPTDPQANNVVVGGQVTLNVSFQSLNMNFPLVPFLSDAKVTRSVDARVEYIPTPGCGQ